MPVQAESLSMLPTLQVYCCLRYKYATFGVRSGILVIMETRSQSKQQEEQFAKLMAVIQQQHAEQKHAAICRFRYSTTGFGAEAE